MKKIISIAIVLFASYFSIAQNGIIKSYAYKQDFVPGVQMEGQEGPNIMTTYFIYLEILKKTDIDIKYMWVGKKCHKPEIVNVVLPVVVQNNKGMMIESGSAELVPKTNNKVVQLMQYQEINDAKLTTGKRLAAKNAFVIAYIYKGKWYYYTGKTIKELQKQFGM